MPGIIGTYPAREGEGTDLGAATAGVAVTPSDSVDLTTPSRMVWVGSLGDLHVTMGGAEVTFTAVPAGTMLPIVVTRIWATGTTAGDIVSLT